MVSLLCRPLRDGGLGAVNNRRPRWKMSEMTTDSGPLTRIQGPDGSLSYGQCGKNRTMTCFICQKYLNKQINTTWQCRVCRMPLCKKDRGREFTCLAEHKNTENEYLACGMMDRDRDNFIMPDKLRVGRRTRVGAESARRRDEAKRKDRRRKAA